MQYTSTFLISLNRVFVCYKLANSGIVRLWDQANKKLRTTLSVLFMVICYLAPVGDTHRLLIVDAYTYYSLEHQQFMFVIQMDHILSFLNDFWFSVPKYPFLISQNIVFYIRTISMQYSHCSYQRTVKSGWKEDYDQQLIEFLEGKIAGQTKQLTMTNIKLEIVSMMSKKHKISRRLVQDCLPITIQRYISCKRVSLDKRIKMAYFTKAAVPDELKKEMGGIGILEITLRKKYIRKFKSFSPSITSIPFTSATIPAVHREQISAVTTLTLFKQRSDALRSKALVGVNTMLIQHFFVDHLFGTLMLNEVW
ncbi:hypothetical protein CAEBREN_23762 [Caenorhabditis brenneri]|uniref:SPK domain-containing protein n=1 Tax=Caenorhabditis brenneri TaxID=135651 RepID=G0PBJ5_CAEBE|nr:hypothetical protein CAEBREN_23762 [Caenorhabditis brenneri]